MIPVVCAESATLEATPHGLRRLRPEWALALVCAATGCAAAPRVADPEFSAQLKAVSARQAELERKVDRLEAQLEASRAAARPGPAEPRAPARPTSLIPADLATVRVGPTAKKAPALPTAVPLREPEPDAVGELLVEDAVGESDFDLGSEAISTGDVERGARRLLAFAARAPRDSRAPLAIYQAGMGLLTFGDAHAAAQAFEQLADDYPLAEQAPEAMVRLADCQVRLKRADRAREAYANVVRRYPGTPAARTAEAGLKSLAEGPAAQ